MRLVHVSIAMAALALVGATALFLKVQQLERDLGSPRAAPREGVRMDPMAAHGERERGPIAGRIPDGGEHRALGEDRGAPASDAPAGGAPASVEERLARLERDQKTLQAGRALPGWRTPQAFARSMDDLAGQLSLTATQRTRIEDAVARGRQRIEDVLRIPDETGKSPYERRAEARKKLEEAMKNPAPGGVLAFATDLMSHRDKKIPGRNDTYSDEIDRIRKETREEIATALDAKQRDAFEQTNVNGLLGEAGQVSFGYAIGDAGQGDQHEMIVEMGSDVVLDAPPPEDEETPGASPAGGGR